MSSGNLSWIGNKWGTLDKSSEWVKLKNTPIISL